MRRSLILILMLACGGIAVAADGALNLEIQNPAIQRVQSRMAARATQIEQWKTKGAIGEDSTGLLKQRDATGQGLAEKKEVRDLVVAENEDRTALFRELVLGNGLLEKDLGRISSAYARMKRQSAAPAHWVHHSSKGEWVQKKELRE